MPALLAVIVLCPAFLVIQDMLGIIMQNSVLKQFALLMVAIRIVLTTVLILKILIALALITMVVAGKVVQMLMTMIV